MSKNDQEGPKIIFRHEIFFPYKMTKTLSKNSQKKFEIHKKFFLSRNDFWTFLITFRQKKFFVNFEFFLWIFSKCFGHFLWKKNFMSKNDFWTFLIIFRHEIFFGPKKNVSILFGGFHHIAWFFYGLNLRDLHQAFRIWCEIGISLRLTHLDWLRSKKMEKIRKPRSQQLFLVLRDSNLQNNCKLPSDQVWQHSVHKILV